MKCRCIKQYDSMDCAAACLASIAWYYGKKIPILEISEALEPAKKERVFGMYVGFLKNWDYLHQHIKKT